MYVCVRAVDVARRDGAGTVIARSRGPLLLAAALMALACYPSLRGTFEAMRYSERAVRSFGYVAETPLTAAPEWLGFLLRDASHVHVYVGLPSVLLAVIGLARWRSRVREGMFRGRRRLRGPLDARRADAGPPVALRHGAPVPALPDLQPLCVPRSGGRRRHLAAHGFAALSELRRPRPQVRVGEEARRPGRSRRRPRARRGPPRDARPEPSRRRAARCSCAARSRSSS